MDLLFFDIKLLQRSLHCNEVIISENVLHPAVSFQVLPKGSRRAAADFRVIWKPSRTLVRSFREAPKVCRSPATNFREKCIFKKKSEQFALIL